MVAGSGTTCVCVFSNRGVRPEEGAVADALLAVREAEVPAGHGARHGRVPALRGQENGSY